MPRNYYLICASHAIRARRRPKPLEPDPGPRYGPPPAVETVADSRAAIAVHTIYKICPASLWREAERQGAFSGSADDRRDGFIHFSTAAQVPQTLRRHFAGQPGLFLIAVDADALGGALRWERSRGGDLFPHLYGDLDPRAAHAVTTLTLRADGTHDVPDLAP